MSIIKTSHLQPLSMGQVLDRAIRLYRQNFFAFVGIIAVAQIISSVAAVIINYFNLEQTYNYADPTNLAATGLGILLAFVLAIISGILLQIATAALTRAVADNYLGNPVSIREAYGKIGRSWLTLIGSSMLMGLLLVIFVLLFMIPCIGWLLAIPGLGGFFYFTVVVLPFLAPVIVLEKQKATAAPGRAWELARRRFWWLFGFAILLYLFGQLVISGPTYLVTFLTTSLLMDGSLSPMTATLIQQAITFLFSVIYYPLQLTCITLMYFDVRVRTEGFDLALLAAQDIEPEKQDQDIDMSVGVTKAREWGPTGEELGYFVLISVGFVIIALILGFAITSLTALFMPTLSGF